MASTTRRSFALATLLVAVALAPHDRPRAPGSAGALRPVAARPAKPRATGPPVPRTAVQIPEVEEPRFDRPDLAMEFFLAQRLAPGATHLPLEQLYAERTAIAAREAAGRIGGLPGPAGILGWTAAGPGNIGGRTRSLVIDPGNPDVMYAGGVAGGVWKTTDGGASWFPTDDHMENLAVTTLAMDPTNPSVIYAGTGEGFGEVSGFVRGLGIFKTTDAGATWIQLPATVSPAVGEGFYWVNKIVISPNDPNRIYAGTRHGVWRSLDGGTSWSVVLANPNFVAGPQQSNGSGMGCTDVAIRGDRNPDVLFAAFGIFDSDGLFRSDDGGTNWVGYATPSYQGRMSIAIAPSDNDRIYLTMTDNGGLGAPGRIVNVFRADDGVTFAPVLDFNHPFSQWLMSYVSIATGCVQAPFLYSQGWYDNIIAVDPVDADVVWVGGIDLYRSDNAGVTFGLTGYWFSYTQPDPPPTYIHVDQHMLVFHPDYNGTTNQTLYATNDGGLFRTPNARAATSQEECPIGPDPGPPPAIVWERLNHGYGVTQYYHGDAAQDVEMLVAGAQDNGTSRVLSHTTPENWQIIFGGDGGYVAIDPTQHQRLFVEVQGFPTIHRSLDGGETFAPATNGITDTDGLFITPFAMDPNDPQVMWTGGQRPWRTTDGAASWQVVGPNFPIVNQISAIAIAPSNSNVVYLGFNNGRVVRSGNALAPSPTWQVLTADLYGGWVSSIAVHPTRPNTVYLTYSNYSLPHLLMSENGGQSWTRRDGSGATGIPDVPSHWVAVRPCNPQQLYVGTELGVFASEDAGLTWAPANDGLPHTVVEALDFRDDQTLVAFTFGRGAFLTGLQPCAPVGVEEEITRRTALAAGPTPFRDVVTIHATLARAGRARLTVHDPAGRLVAVLEDGHLEAGPLRREWDGRDPSGRAATPGVYFVRLTAPDGTLTRKIALRH